MKSYVIAGIGTGAGKTVVSAILTQALEADYWKPVQAGNLHYTDTDFVRDRIDNTRSIFHPEAYRLHAGIAPHAAAKLQGVEMDFNALPLPMTHNRLIVELAGGLMVPINNHQLMVDLLETWKLPVIIVSKNYLGSINHTLLTVEVLKRRAVPVAGIIFNGVRDGSIEDFIVPYTGLPCIARLEPQRAIDKKVVTKYAQEWREKLLYFDNNN